MKIKAADALSRLRATGEDDTPLEDDLPLLVVDATDKPNDTPVISARSDEIVLLIAREKNISSHALNTSGTGSRTST